MFCVYDIPNEAVYWCEPGHRLTDDELRANIMILPTIIVRQVRHAKGLPMPMPPVDVSVQSDMVDWCRPPEGDES